MEFSTHPVGVIGHKNPDTDSICSAIAYADFKSLTDPARRYIPLRAGSVNEETAYVLSRFGADCPALCEDVHAQVEDIDIRQIDGIGSETTIRKAWEIMRDKNISTLPVTNTDGTLEGLLSLNDIAMANMNFPDSRALASSRTSYRNLLEALDGTLLTGDPDACITTGKVVVGAASPEVLEEVVEAGDVVIVANRYEAQLCSIELDAACLIVCTGSAVAKTILAQAVRHGCAVISTPHDTYPVACKIAQSVPVRYYMRTDNLITFRLSDPVEDVREVMGKVRFVYFPVLGSDGKYLGVISRRNLINLHRKELILVDHNEKTQCVDGWDDAVILEIIDHHRIGSIETTGPVYFRNQPVGCTATIIYQMYQEHNLQPVPKIAGLLLSAILSDTLKFQSPTCTPLDQAAASALAAAAGVDIDELAVSMFEAGEALDGKTASELFQQDYKVFTSGDMRIGVGQGSFISAKNLSQARALLAAYLPDAPRELHVDLAFYLLTSLQEQSSLILPAGEGAAALLVSAFGTEPDSAGTFLLPGVVSRKKQFLPALLSALQNQ